jgi:hypothetical protein
MEPDAVTDTAAQELVDLAARHLQEAQFAAAKRVEANAQAHHPWRPRATDAELWERACELADHADRFHWEHTLTRVGAGRFESLRSLSPSESHPLIERALELAGVVRSATTADVEAHRPHLAPLGPATERLAHRLADEVERDMRASLEELAHDSDTPPEALAETVAAVMSDRTSRTWGMSIELACGNALGQPEGVFNANPLVGASVNCWALKRTTTTSSASVASLRSGPPRSAWRWPGSRQRTSRSHPGHRVLAESSDPFLPTRHAPST